MLINSEYGTVVKGELEVLFTAKKKFWNRCMLFKTGSKDILVTCFMKKLYTTDLQTFEIKEKVKVFEPITNLLELKKNHYLLAMTENMVIFDIRHRLKIGKNYRQHKIIENYNLIELEYVKERRLLLSAGCDGLLILWRVCFKNELDPEKIEESEEEIPTIFLMKIQKVKFHKEEICRIFSVIYLRFENKIILCNEGNRLYVFSFVKKSPEKDSLVESVEVLNAEYIMKDLDYNIAGLYYFEHFQSLGAFHWKNKFLHFLDIENK